MLCTMHPSSRIYQVKIQHLRIFQPLNKTASDYRQVKFIKSVKYNQHILESGSRNGQIMVRNVDVAR